LWSICPLRERDWSFTNAIKPDVDTFRESLPIIEEQLAAHKGDKKTLIALEVFVVRKHPPILNTKVLKMYTN
jgi:hypothetical protein